MTSARARPVVGIPASVRTLEQGMEFHGTADQYLRAVREHVGASVFTIPGVEDLANGAELLELVDGLLLTGSFSNMHPSSYGDEVRTELGFYDPKRDALTVHLIRQAVALGVPVLGICRGMQEMNVAFGGTLHQVLHEVPGFDSHLADPALPLAEQFGPAHDIVIEPGGVLAALMPERRYRVSTAHQQGVGRLGEGLRVEATSDDGVIEAVSVANARAFALGVQFHPEWDTRRHPLYAQMFAAFRAAVEARRDSRAARAPAQVAQ